MTEAGNSPDLSLGLPTDRADRLISINGSRQVELKAEYSVDGRAAWHPATVYPGADVDEWRTVEPEVWNRSATGGVLPSGDQTCVWACWFDIDAPTEGAVFRLRDGDRVVLEQTVTAPDAGLVINHLSISDHVSGDLQDPWSLRPSEISNARAPSIHGAVRIRRLESEYPTAVVENADHQPLVLEPGLDGWHRVYLGLEPESSVQFSLSGDDVEIPVPCESSGKLKREYLVTCADMTGQDVYLRLGGSRVWTDASIRYVRFVPMSEPETDVYQGLRDRATAGRPFAGYLEQVTDGYYNGDTIPLRDFTRNEMRLHKRRGCTEV